MTLIDDNHGRKLRPALTALIGEIEGTLRGDLPKNAPRLLPDLPLPEARYAPDRFHFLQSQNPVWCKHFQFKLDWPAEAALLTNFAQLHHHRAGYSGDRKVPNRVPHPRANPDKSAHATTGPSTRRRSPTATNGYSGRQRQKTREQASPAMLSSMPCVSWPVRDGLCNASSTAAGTCRHIRGFSDQSSTEVGERMSMDDMNFDGLYVRPCGERDREYLEDLIEADPYHNDGEGSQRRRLRSSSCRESMAFGCRGTSWSYAQLYFKTATVVRVTMDSSSRPAAPKTGNATAISSRGGWSGLRTG